MRRFEKMCFASVLVVRGQLCSLLPGELKRSTLTSVLPSPFPLPGPHRTHLPSTATSNKTRSSHPAYGAIVEVELIPLRLLRDGEEEEGRKVELELNIVDLPSPPSLSLFTSPARTSFCFGVQIINSSDSFLTTSSLLLPSILADGRLVEGRELRGSGRTVGAGFQPSFLRIKEDRRTIDEYLS